MDISELGKALFNIIIEKLIPIDDAALACERAYRRGFQHGIHYAHKMNISDADASDYRHGDYSRSFGAPERDAEGNVHNPWKGINHSLVKRFEMENVDVINRMFTFVPKILAIVKAAAIACDDFDLNCEDINGSLDNLRAALMNL